MKSKSGFNIIHPSPRFFDVASAEPDVALEGFSGPELGGRWTDGEIARLIIPYVPDGKYVVVFLTSAAFVARGKIDQQTAEIYVNGKFLRVWNITHGIHRKRPLVLREEHLAGNDKIEIELRIRTCKSPAELGISADPRSLGVRILNIDVVGTDTLPPQGSAFWAAGDRVVGTEAVKTWDERVFSGFWEKYATGPRVLDIGFLGYGGTVEPILEGAIGVDVDYPGYDGRRLPFPDNSQDAVFSSHCLEHIADYVNAICDWHRVTKVGGHIITAVPSIHLYERQRFLPSRWNGDHKRFYSPSSLLAEFEAALKPNTYRVRFLEENDRGYDYTLPPHVHAGGCYEIVLVIEKIAPPAWDLG